MEQYYHQEDGEGRIIKSFRIKGVKSFGAVSHGPGRATKHFRPSAGKIPEVRTLMSDRLDNLP